MGRPSNTEERRAQIVDALLSVMAREGWERATVAAVAHEASLAPGLVHYHFANKQEILIALVARLVEQLDARVAARSARAGDDPRALLDAFVDAHVALGDDADPRAVAAWVVIGAEAVRQREVRELYAKRVETALERLRALVSACLRADGRSARNAGSIAAAIVSAIEGAYLVSAAAPGVLPAGYASPTLRRMIDGLLAAESPSPQALRRR